ncbi:hypothetical protein [Nocardia sp. NPDC057440]|uniref:hypothetical protein n=1 Tax=Nocardia sp. NPDC057440 TaxID=3346134 RepID=UPI00366F90B4
MSRNYRVLPDGRIPLWVMLAVEDAAYAVTPWHRADRPMRLSVEDIADDCDISPVEVVGGEFTAIGDSTALHSFRLMHDPRL